MKREITSFANGRWSAPGAQPIQVTDKFRGHALAALHPSAGAEVDAAVAAADRAFRSSRIELPERVAIFGRVAAALRARAAEFAEIITREGGSTIKEAAKEVERAIATLEITAEEAKRIPADIVPLEAGAGGAGKFAFLTHHPVGVVCAITAFNSPLNTPIHKIAPALAAGNSVVIKPPTQTPISAAMLCDIFAEAGLPPGWLNYVAGSGAAVGEHLLADPRIAFYHFTGSTEVGRRIASKIGLRGSSLELGSIAATIICADADLPAAVADVSRAGYAKAGQVCTSTQICYVEERVADEVRERLAMSVAALAYGDPMLDTTQVGPLISPAEAARVADWMGEAAAMGARTLTGGARDGSVVQPTLMDNVNPDAKLVRNEVFGPVVSVVAVPSLADAVRRYNEGPYGLAAGVFTADLGRAFHAVRHLRSGTVHINSASSSRLDAMPFGGVKDSGHGKEGPKYAIAEMSERRLTVLHGV